MKKIKIFLASSEELKEERTVMEALFNRLNKLFKGRGLELDLEIWEYLDASMTDKRKQDEYNDVLKQCDICIVLFWRKFGCYTGEELDTAYQRMRQKEKPYKIYVFFKNPNSDEITPELKDFIANYEKRYGGHFFSKFEHVDTMKLEFLLQLENYQKELIGESAIEVRNEHVYVDNEEFVDLNNIPFAAKNEGFLKKKSELARLRKEIEQKQQELEKKKNKLERRREKLEKDPDDEDYQEDFKEAKEDVKDITDSLQKLLDKKNKLEEEFEREQQNLFNTARRITELRGVNISQRMTRAIEAFEAGDTKRADIILDEAEKDADQALEDIQVAKKVGLQSLEELILKASVKMANDTIPIDDRVAETHKIYDKAVKLAKEAGCDNQKFVDLLEEYSRFLFDNNLYKDALIICKKLLSQSIANGNEKHIAWTYNMLGGILNCLGKFDDAFNYFQLALKIWIKFEDNDNVASVYNNIGVVYQNKSDFTTAISFYEKAIEMGNLNAVENLGWLYYDGKGVPINYSKTISLFLSLAKQGNSTAQNNLGYMYSKGIGVEMDDTKAVEWYSKSANQGDSTALMNLGHCYIQGKGVKTDVNKGLELLHKAAMLGEAQAQSSFAWLYEKGEYINKDEEKAFYWYLKAANQNYARAQYNLAAMYEEGRGIEKNFEAAINWYIKAADNGNSDAQSYLGWIYEYGDGVEQDYNKAFEWYEKAAKQGDETAQCHLGCFFAEGRGVEQDYQKATEWYSKAAEQGNDMAQCNLSWHYYWGKGIEKDYRKAAEWSLKAAEQGHTQAQCQIGFLYENGYGVEQDHHKAAEWYLKAAEQNDATAQCNLAWLYAEGKGVERDYYKAAEWYLKSAEQGYARAQNNLAVLYRDGKEVEEDYNKAVEWYLKAAEQRYEHSYNELVWTYHLMGKSGEALPWAEKAIAAFPSDSNIIDTLATVYQDLGRYEEALQQFEQCLKLQKGQQLSKEYIQKIKAKIAQLKKLTEQQNK